MSSRSAPALRVSGADVAYGRIRAVQDVSIEVPDRSITALVGANGAGKSSLLKAIAGLVPLQAGDVAVAGCDVTRLPAHRRVREVGIALVPEGRGVFGQMSVSDNLALGARVGAMRAGGDDASTEEAYAMFPILGERRAMDARLLSGGEQQMLVIARALMMRPAVLLVDEPSMGLAPLVVRDIFSRLRSVLAERGVAVFLVEQDSKVALDVADHAYVIEHGRIEAAGTAAEIAADPRLQAAYLGSEPEA